ncbi:MAG: pyruvate, water dikinase regulatory protein [Bacteroidales bacterium]|nr:pyruvate, water dikinase regulatory protein [Bacteroidales bacterium]MDZ4205473.1 pyruvate, water dikinase regulatory protein [Bacteroidales bacterium]
MHKVFIVSDGTGRTATQALRAALMQFPDQDVEIILHSEIRTEDDIEQAVKESHVAKGFIVHTLVSNQLREVMITTARKKNVETIDLMGPLLARLSGFFRHSPTEKPGLFSEINREYFKRIDAMQFAFQHDDGQRPDELHKAEIVLLGVSRTFKTPLSIYLAFKGWFVANVPVILDLAMPEQIYNLPQGRVFCLTTYAHNLASLRHVRQEYLGVLVDHYANLEYVQHEINYANNLFKRRPEWPVIRVTNKPIEEIASEILAVRNEIIKSGP